MAYVANHFDLDPFSRAIYVFRSRRPDRLKLLVRDGTLGLKSPTAAAVRFAIVGFITLDNMASLDEILTANIAQIRRLDVADRAASEREN